MFAILLWIATAPLALAECQLDRIDLRGDWGNARFTIEVADTPETQSLGLMNRASMPQSAGMLFVYPEERPVYFWMKNTLIPLDMIFLSGDGIVQRVHANAQPLDETPIHGGDNIQYVLEINGGLAAMLGIAPGSEVRHPAIGAALWACP
jgi:uncharacterized membrane protein (UPF0127 family)